MFCWILWQKFRSYEKLKEELSSLNMDIKTDGELMQNLIDQFNKSDNRDDKLNALFELEDLVHKVFYTCFNVSTASINSF